MSLELIEKLLVGMVPHDAVAPVHSNFKAMRSEPAEAFTVLWNHLYPILKNQDADGHIAATNGILIGVALYYGLQRSDNLLKMINDYIEDRSRVNGENVINFYEARAGRKLC